MQNFKFLKAHLMVRTTTRTMGAIPGRSQSQSSADRGVMEEDDSEDGLLLDSQPVAMPSYLRTIAEKMASTEQLQEKVNIFLHFIKMLWRTCS
jgi:hypothetical protein